MVWNLFGRGRHDDPPPAPPADEAHAPAKTPPEDSLDEVLAAVLHAVNRAQETTNRHSMALVGAADGTRGGGDGLGVPNARIDRIELDLAFAFAAGSGERPRIPLPRALPVAEIDRFGETAAVEALKLLATLLRKYAADAGNGEAAARRATEPDMVAWLRERMRAALSATVEGLLQRSGEGDDDDAGAIERCVEETLGLALRDHPQISGLLGANRIAAAIDTLNQGLRPKLVSAIERTRRAIVDQERVLQTRLDVIVDAERLETLSLERVQRMRLTIDLRKLSWVRSGDDDTEHLVVEE